ncbi:MAG TPA: hypothetical protein VK835_05920 [Bacteroidia bacterium]|jgi:hypothetical protein|nr:hypothetical protein [Bacteroidia bacterium]
MKRALIFVLFITGFSLLLPHTGLAQGNFHENTKGGRKKESGNQTTTKRHHGLFKKRDKSAGNADAFASNSARGGGGFFHKLFHGKGGEPRNASLRKTKPGKVQNHEQKGLFRRNQSPKKAGNEKYLKRQKKDRSKNRSRGSSFSGK